MLNITGFFCLYPQNCDQKKLSQNRFLVNEAKIKKDIKHLKPFVSTKCPRPSCICTHMKAVECKDFKHYHNSTNYFQLKKFCKNISVLNFVHASN